MPKLKTVEEVSYEILEPLECEDVFLVKTETMNIIERDRQAIREALREGINELDFYGWDKNNQRMIKDKALTVIDDLLGGEVTE